MRCFLDAKNKTVYFLLVGVVALMVAGMLYFGLRPKGYRPGNSAQWLAEGPGIAFDRFGVAYTDRLDFADLADRDFSVVLALRPELSGRPDFRFVMALHDGADERQLVIGQWRGWIIAMNGDDYHARRRIGRIQARLAADEPAVFIVLTSGADGTRLYVNGAPVKSDPGLRLGWPHADGGARLVVGNSIYGRHPWRGEMGGLAVFGHALNAEDVGMLLTQWRASGFFDFASYEGVKMLFPLVEGQGTVANDWSGNGFALEVPRRMRILEKEVLVPLGRAWRDVDDMGDFVLDVVLNWIGFMPLGFMMAMLLFHSGNGTLRKYYRQGALLFCFGLSLTLEVGQVWLPSRYSHLWDLVLNTLGGATGVVLFVVLSRLGKMGRLS